MFCTPISKRDGDIGFSTQLDFSKEEIMRETIEPLALKKHGIWRFFFVLLLLFSDMISGNDDEIEIDSTKEIGTSVAPLKLVAAGYTISNDTQLNAAQTDIVLDTNSSHFEFTFSRSGFVFFLSYQLKTKLRNLSCLLWS